MKKRCIGLVFALLLTVMAGFASCDESPETGTTVGADADTEASQVTRPAVMPIGFRDNANKYQIVDSFRLDDEKYYYIFELGTITNMPMNLAGADGVYFDGTNTELSFTLTETNVEQSAKLVENTIENGIDLTTSTYVEGSVGGPIAAALEASVAVGIEKSVTTSLTKTESESFYTSVTNESTFQKNVTYTMDRNDPVGYYFYTPLASVKVFEVVVYDPALDRIEYMFSYNQYGESLPGLYYSPTSFLDCNDVSIVFNESQLPTLNTPQKQVTTAVEVSVDPSGADCDVTALDLRLGSPYGTLPNVTKQGHDLKYWSCDGRVITENDMVLSDKPIVAVWELRTSATIDVNKTIEVSSTYKLNPFGLLVSGYDGESGAKPMDIQEHFDFETLKKEGYKMRLVLNYKVKNGSLALWGLTYVFHFHSNGKQIVKLTDDIDNSDYISRKMTSELIPLEKVTGNIDFTVSTENVIPVTIKNLKITVEFVK